MYTFLDRKGGRRDAATGGDGGGRPRVPRAQSGGRRLPMKTYWCLGPMFRYENPQAGRFGSITRWASSVLARSDASATSRPSSCSSGCVGKWASPTYSIGLHRWGMKTAGRPIAKVLKEYLRPRVPKLCEIAGDRFDRNSLRIFDCKVPAGQSAIWRTLPDDGRSPRSGLEGPSRSTAQPC